MATEEPRKDDNLRWERRNRWNDLDAEEKAQMEEYCSRYMSFLSQAKTEREVHDWTLKAAADKGFRPIEEVCRDNNAPLDAGTKVYRSFGGKTLLLCQIGRRPLTDGLHIVGGHTDAPRLDAKPNPLYEDSELALLDTHYYGGIKKYHWVTMPLALHGLIVKQDGTKVNISVGEDSDDPVFVITDLLPHLDKDQAEKKMEKAIPGENLNVLLGAAPQEQESENSEEETGKTNEKVKQNLLQQLFDKYGIKEEDFASAELEIVPAGVAREAGLDGSMMLGYGHDDRISSYAALQALLQAEETPEFTSIVLMCDREEIGSKGATGMDSTFFENSVAELLNSCTEGYTDLDLRRTLERSRMLSADVCAVHDPNYPDVSSPNNAGKLNAGIVVNKYTGSRGKAGCSEASAEFMAELRRMFNEQNVFWQTAELGKVDQGGGGTISMFFARYGMDVVDCGAGLLSMHAPWEIAGKLDAYMAFKGYQTFLQDRRRET